MIKSIIPILLVFLVACSNEEENSKFYRDILFAKDMQEMCRVQFDRGNGFYADVQSDFVSKKGDDLKAARIKLGYVLSKMDLINESCFNALRFIDSIKWLCLKESEYSDIQKDQWENNIKKGWQGFLEIDYQKINNSFDASSILDENSEQLKNELNLVRNSIVEKTGNYSWGVIEFEIRPSEFSWMSESELEEKTLKMVEASKANLKEDKRVLIDLYKMLSYPEKVKLKDKLYNSIFIQFKDARLLETLALLSSYQKDILATRALAFAHWKSKIGSCFDGFTSISSLATGPNVAQPGDQVVIKVLMAGYDDYRPMFVEIDNPLVDSIAQKDGYCLVYLNVKPGENKFKGEVSIKNNSGSLFTRDWEWSIYGIEK